MVSAVPTSDLDLDLCAPERIRHSVNEQAGSIQPQGMLVVVDPDDRQIVPWQLSRDLLVDDDADVRAFTVEPVRELGYDAPEARDGNCVTVHHGRLDPGVQLITQPFAFEDLAARLRSVLDSQDSSRHVN